MKNKILILILLGLFLKADLFNFYRYNKINQAYKKGDYKKAIYYLKKLEDSNIRNFDLAMSYYKNKEYKKAITYFKRAYGDGVDEFSRLYNLANSYFKLKKYQKAIVAYKEALKIKNDKDARFNLLLAIKATVLKKEKKNKKEKKEKNKKSKKKNHTKLGKKDKKKLTKKELKKLKRLLKKEKLANDIKKIIKKSFKEKEIPVLMYKVKDGKRDLNKPW